MVVGRGGRGGARGVVDVVVEDGVLPAAMAAACALVSTIGGYGMGDGGYGGSGITDGRNVTETRQVERVVFAEMTPLLPPPPFADSVNRHMRVICR